MHTRAAGALALILTTGAALGQVVTDTAPTTPPAPADPGSPSVDSPAEPKWSFNASADFFFIPDQRDYISPTVTADKDWLHFEFRYNDAALDTATLFVGYNFKAGDEFTFQLTPIVGGFFGSENGIAPGYELTLAYKDFEFTATGEYLFDLSDSTRSSDYFYNWSQLTYSPLEWFNFGLAAQRTKVYKSDREFEPGVFVGFVVEKVDLAFYVFKLNEDQASFVFSIGVGF